MRACPTCGAPAAGATCLHCGGPTAGGADLREGTRALPCPRCEDGRSLSQVTVQGVGVDACGECGGVWLEVGELERLCLAGPGGLPGGVGPASAAPVRRREVRYLPCPACGTRMTRRNHGRVSGVIVDVCPTHGTWLDAGELEAVRAFALRSASPHGGGGRATQPPPLPEASRADGRTTRRSSWTGRDPGRATGLGGRSFVDDLLDLLGG